MNVPDHAHCEVCHVPIERSQRFCGSAECEAAHQQQVKEKKRQVYIMVALLAALVVMSYLFRLR